MTLAARVLERMMIDRPLGSRSDSSRPFQLDRYAAWVICVLIVINVLWVTSRIDVRWHLARNATSIDFIPYLGSRWWVHAEYLTQVGLMIWLARAIAKGRAWAMAGLATLSVSFIFSEIHYGNAYPIFEDSLILVYLVLRLSGGLGPKVKDLYLSRAEQSE